MYKIRVQNVKKTKDDNGVHFTPLNSYTVTECDTVQDFGEMLVAVAQTRFKGCKNRLMSITINDDGDLTAEFGASITKA